jgi:hypothetical protein
MAMVQKPAAFPAWRQRPVKPSVAFFLELLFFLPRWCESELLELEDDEDVEYWLEEEESLL